MAGIYIHIPFCKTRCIYCDFFSSTSERMKKRYVNALCEELVLRKNYLEDQLVRTVYFGGGTPSQLNATDFDIIFKQIALIAPLTAAEEITLEANPDDITPAYLDLLRNLPFNRISLGIQSFSDQDLTFLNRRHDSKSAIRAVDYCKAAGFTNLSIDLMYGLPGQTPALWKENLQQAIELDVQHVSAYHLTYEKGTRLHRMLQNNQISCIDEEVSVEMFSILIDELTAAGFEHYEISNFSKSGFHSIHNSSYWDGTHYMGIGASAHSYNGTSRQWNIASLDKYIESVHNREPLVEIEQIDKQTAYNDFVITRMRTSKGLPLDELNKLFGAEMTDYCRKQAGKHLLNKTIEQVDNMLRLTKAGIFVSDGVMTDLISTD